MVSTTTTSNVRSQSARVGESRIRPDAGAKIEGSFDFSSDLHAPGMLWGRTLRSPHASARIVSVDTEAAQAVEGVEAVLVADDVPGKRLFGLATQDQPVLAEDVVRYCGEAIACVAARTPEAARAAIEAVEVTYELLEPITDPEVALLSSRLVHPEGNVYRSLPIRYGNSTARGEVSVESVITIGVQDQAFLGTEAVLAVPELDGALTLYLATQDLHTDQHQIAACLDLPPERLSLIMSGIGGAFGAREDLSLQVHAGMLALRTGHPVKMIYSREESFLGHVHRHPATIAIEHSANTDGRLVSVSARILLDGGAYASTSGFVVSNTACFVAGPYRVEGATVDAFVVRTNNPPSGAMRGFGTVQACIAHELQMDKLADALGIDRLELRRRNVVAHGDQLITGQRLTGSVPGRECLDAAEELASVRDARDGSNEVDVRLSPGGRGNTIDSHRVKRGVGYGVGIKNVMFPEGFDDYSVASVRLSRVGDTVAATVRCAAAEVGQGFVTLVEQIVQTVLGVEDVNVRPPDSTMKPAGSTSASRQAWMSGAAIQGACEQVITSLRGRLIHSATVPVEGLVFESGGFSHRESGEYYPIASLLADEDCEAEFEYHHRPTQPLDESGQGDAHVAFAMAAHRAVVDVDLDLGLVRVVEISTGQDVGFALNPLQVVGQIEGGIVQGLGLAVMEELLLDKGRVVNPSFTDYLIPTVLDIPDIRVRLIEQPEPNAPFGAKGVGEAPAISSVPAILNAIRDATGLDITKVPFDRDALIPSS